MMLMIYRGENSHNIGIGVHQYKFEDGTIKYEYLIEYDNIKSARAYAMNHHLKFRGIGIDGAEIWQ